MPSPKPSRARAAEPAGSSCRARAEPKPSRKPVAEPSLSPRPEPEAVARARAASPSPSPSRKPSPSPSPSEPEPIARARQLRRRARGRSSRAVAEPEPIAPDLDDLPLALAQPGVLEEPTAEALPEEAQVEAEEAPAEAEDDHAGLAAGLAAAGLAGAAIVEGIVAPDADASAGKPSRRSRGAVDARPSSSRRPRRPPMPRPPPCRGPRPTLAPLRSPSRRQSRRTSPRAPAEPAIAPVDVETPAAEEVAEAEAAAVEAEPAVVEPEPAVVEPEVEAPVAAPEIVPLPQTIIAASVDVGALSSHLLVAAVTGHMVEPLLDESSFLGLGDRVATNGFIGSDARAELVANLAEYADKARALGATSVTFVGTEPLRRAADAAGPRLRGPGPRGSAAPRPRPRRGGDAHAPRRHGRDAGDVGAARRRHRWRQLRDRHRRARTGPSTRRPPARQRLRSRRSTRRPTRRRLKEIDAMRAGAKAAIVADPPDANPARDRRRRRHRINLLKLLPATAIDRMLTRRRITVALAMLTVQRSSRGRRAPPPPAAAGARAARRRAHRGRDPRALRDGPAPRVRRGNPGGAWLLAAATAGPSGATGSRRWSCGWPERADTTAA